MDVMDIVISWVESVLNFTQFCLETEQYMQVQYLVGFKSASNKFGTVTGKNCFLPKYVDNNFWSLSTTEDALGLPRSTDKDAVISSVITASILLMIYKMADVNLSIHIIH